jgi:hypothetical protein
MNKQEEKKQEEQYDPKLFEISLQIRNFEIELFWKRSLFFWGFIASAFVGFATLYDKNPFYSIVIAHFGLICSLCWTLLNRGSKFWQENWERKVADMKLNKYHELFTTIEPIESKFFMLRAKKFSVSKLTIGLSDFVVLLWFGIILNAILHEFDIVLIKSNGTSIFVILLLTILYGIYLIIFGRTSEKK